MTKLLTWSRRNRTGSVLSGDFLAASQNCFWDAYLDGWIHKWGCIKFKASYSYKLIQERNLIIFVGNTVNTCLPIHWTDHEEAVPELLGDVGQISGFRADHAPVINQAVLRVNIEEKKYCSYADNSIVAPRQCQFDTQVLKAVNFNQARVSLGSPDESVPIQRLVTGLWI